MTEQQPEYITDAMEMMGISEPRQIITEVSGFIPVFEVVLHHYKDYMTALVFGRMWQYCGMSDGVCKASLDRIGKDIEVSAVTVMRHAEKLVNDGYLIDTTPDRRNAPHVYMDGRKVEMKSRFTAGMTESNATVIKSKATVIKSQLIKQDNTNIKQESTAAENFGSICKVYSDNIALITPMVADELKDIADLYPAGWFEDAVKEAVKNNVRKLNYVKKILESWQANGRAGKKEKALPPREEGKGFYA